MIKIQFLLKFRQTPGYSNGGNGGYGSSGSYSCFTPGTYSEGGYSETEGYSAGGYSEGSYSACLSSGLANSARMVSLHLSEVGINNEEVLADLVQVVDSNSIDREVYRFRPDVAIIEAFWATPAKMRVLRQLHPTVKWIIRGHSNIPFLASESFAFDWIPEYVKIKNVYVATNSNASLRDLRELVMHRNGWSEEQAAQKVRLFTNFYYAEYPDNWVHDNFSLPIDISCFGAIRPLKNHVLQAIAAIRFARQLGRPLRFHVNTGRYESRGSSAYQSLKNIFSSGEGATLVEHPWMPHEEFVPLVSTMDIGMQVSFSETFNIVTADAVSTGVPVVTSTDIFWVEDAFKADPTSADEMVERLHAAHEAGKRGLHRTNQAGLTLYNEQSSALIQSNVDFILQHTDLIGTTD